MAETEEIPEGMRRCKNPNCENQFEDYPPGLLPKTTKFYHRGGYFFLADGTRRQRLKDTCKSCKNKGGMPEELPDGMKKCRGKCGKILPATAEFFHKHKGGGYGVTTTCRLCTNKHGIPIEKEELPEGKKRCRGECGKILPATTKFFGRDKSRKDGLKTYCKLCKNKQERERHRERHPQKPAALLAAEGKKKCRGECGEILPATLEHFTSSGKVSKQGHPYLRSVCKGCFNKHGMPEKLPEGKKRCTECAKILPATLEYFKSQPQSPQAYRIPRIGAKRLFKDDGRPYLTSKCKSCINQLQRENYDPEKQKKYNDQYQDENKEELLEKAAERRARPGAKEQAVEYQRGHRKTQRNEQTKVLNTFYIENDVPEYVWHEGEFAEEEDFQDALEWCIVKRGLPVERWPDLEEHGRPDIYVPLLDLFIEVKLLSSMWNSKREKIRKQIRKYRKISDVVIVSLDGRPDWWADEEEFADVPWLSPQMLLSWPLLGRSHDQETREVQPYIRWYGNGQKIDRRTYKSGKLITAVAWRINGEKCHITKVVDGNGVVVRYNKEGAEFGRFTYKDGELVDTKLAP
jgi:hypothetical protein